MHDTILYDLLILDDTIHPLHALIDFTYLEILNKMHDVVFFSRTRDPCFNFGCCWAHQQIPFVIDSRWKKEIFEFRFNI